MDNPEEFTFGSLFSGAGGLDLGLERAGLKCVFQVENDKYCLTLLKRHWPDVPKNEIRPCVGLVGGDPCPIRSLPAKIVGTKRPDLAGYFLAMVSRIKPRWVLRENVPAPDVVEFKTALEVLGYYCVIVETNSAAFTGQKRSREFVAGFNKQETLDRFVNACNDAESTEGACQANDKAQTPVGCLTTHRYRGDTQDGYVYEGSEKGLRILSLSERESLQGWPDGWTLPLSDTQRARVVGNGVTAPVAEWIGKRIYDVQQKPGDI